MDSKQIRQKFLDFFSSKDHKIVKSAPMVIKDDPTLMFTNAGMNQFKDIFLAIKQAQDLRVANSQKCLRVSGKHNDLEDVGHDTYHHTMFEMLGNWSFGDYFKNEAIQFAWELLTEVLKIDKSRIYITVFGGDKSENLDIDKEAEDYWKKYISEDRILYGSKKDNFWEMGDTGPCGPCSEIHVDIRDSEEREKIDGKTLVNMDHPEVIEIWNLVFIQYNRKADGSLVALPNKHVDTGMGFERLCMVLQNKKSNYDTDLFSPIINEIESLTGYKYKDSKKTDIAMRVIADHLRTVAFAITDGQLPSNVKAGYVIRRILRRAVRYAYSFLNVKDEFIYKLIPVFLKIMGEAYPELVKQKDIITNVIKEEEKTFLRTLDKGIKLLEAKIDELKSDNKNKLSGQDAFTLYDTYGFPLDLTALIAKENNIEIDIDGFEKEMNKQKSRARADGNISTGDWTIITDNKDIKFIGYDKLEDEINITKYRKINQKGKDLFHLVFNATPFYAESGGQVGDTGVIISEKEKIKIINTITEHNTTIHIADKLPEYPNENFIAYVNKERRQNIARNHSATHLLHDALREIIGNHVEQKGSLVDENRLRFDFSHFNKLEAEQIREIEQKVNQKIIENIELEEHRSIEISKAQQMGAISLFGEKYGDYVRVIKFDKATELCGGTHVKSTGSIGFFKIISESAIAAGIRRIEAVTGLKSIELVFYTFDENKKIAELFNNSKDLAGSISKLIEQNNQNSKIIEDFNKQKTQSLAKELFAKAENSVDYKLISSVIEVNSANDLKEICTYIRTYGESFICILGAIINDKPNLIVAISEDLVKEKNLNAGNIVREAAKEIKGGGGGQAFIATAGGSDKNGIEKAVNKAKELVLS